MPKFVSKGKSDKCVNEQSNNQQQIYQEIPLNCISSGIPICTCLCQCCLSCRNYSTSEEFVRDNVLSPNSRTVLNISNELHINGSLSRSGDSPSLEGKAVHVSSDVSHFSHSQRNHVRHHSCNYRAPTPCPRRCRNWRARMQSH